MANTLKFYPSGDSGLIIEVGNEISKEVNREIRSLTYLIQKAELKEIVELIPTYITLLIIYNPIETTYSELVEKIKRISEKIDNTSLVAVEVIHIPTIYGGKYGTDLKNVANHNGLTEKEVIEIHCSTDYLVYMLGFTPGFPYLGGMSEKIATPRLKEPRSKISAGSVGIAGNQTGIYPIDSPGGWQIIGRTPVKLFDPEREDVLLKAGQYIRFFPITLEEYKRIVKMVEKNEYKVKVTRLEGEV